MGLNFHLFRDANTDIHISCTFNVIYTLDYDKGGVERTEIRTLQVYTTFDKLTYNLRPLTPKTHFNHGTVSFIYSISPSMFFLYKFYQISAILLSRIQKT